MISEHKLGIQMVRQMENATGVTHSQARKALQQAVAQRSLERISRYNVQNQQTASTVRPPEVRVTESKSTLPQIMPVQRRPDGVGDMANAGVTTPDSVLAVLVEESDDDPPLYPAVTHNVVIKAP